MIQAWKGWEVLRHKVWRLRLRGYHIVEGFRQFRGSNTRLSRLLDAQEFLNEKHLEITSRNAEVYKFSRNQLLKIPFYFFISIELAFLA